MLKSFKIYNKSLSLIPGQNKLLISTINAHSYNMTHVDDLYCEALMKSDVLIPDGISVVWAIKWLTGKKLKKIAGADLFFYELKRLQQSGGKCFFLGSTEIILKNIKEKLNREFPNIIVQTYSPPFKPEFNEDENKAMIKAINDFQPDVLMVGMTAPKQEKWAFQHYDYLKVGHICCIGAVFDFYGGTVNRAPKWMIKFGLEWFYRLIKEPKRMWRRYLIGNMLFVGHVIKEKFKIGKPYRTILN